MKLLITESAKRDIAESAEFYKAIDRNLAIEFVTEVRNCLKRIRAHPSAWTRLSGRTRRCLVRRFPHGVIYQTRTDCILIVAVMHLKRSPHILDPILDE